MNFNKMNAINHIKELQNDEPKFFSFSGIVSEITKNGRVTTPQDAIKMKNEKLKIGIQLNDPTAQPCDFSIEYDPNEISPSAAPVADIDNKNWKVKKL